jgi:branched-chain amino acid transport system substrate-binding protein
MRGMRRALRAPDIASGRAKRKLRLQSTAIKTQLGPLLNGIVDFDNWLPFGRMATPEAIDFLERYQAKSAAAGVDLLGYNVPPFAYADLQVLQQAVEGVGTLDQPKLAAYLHTHTFKTVVGDITFDTGGEWTESRDLLVQFQNVRGNDVEQFKDPKVPQSIVDRSDSAVPECPIRDRHRGSGYLFWTEAVGRF